MQAIEKKDCGERVREIIILTLSGAISGLNSEVLRDRANTRSRHRRAQRSPSPGRRASRSRSPPGLSPPSPPDVAGVGAGDSDDPLSQAMALATRAMQQASVGRGLMGPNISPSEFMRNQN